MYIFALVLKIELLRIKIYFDAPPSHTKNVLLASSQKLANYKSHCCRNSIDFSICYYYRRTSIISLSRVQDYNFKSKMHIILFCDHGIYRNRISRHNTTPPTRSIYQLQEEKQNLPSHINTKMWKRSAYEIKIDVHLWKSFKWITAVLSASYKWLLNAQTSRVLSFNISWRYRNLRRF